MRPAADAGTSKHVRQSLAIEVGSRPDILDNGSMQSYYEEFGFQSHSDGYHTSYETQAAIDIQGRVMVETARVSSEY